MVKYVNSTMGGLKNIRPWLKNKTNEKEYGNEKIYKVKQKNINK